jgi:hypothetical protein
LQILILVVDNAQTIALNRNDSTKMRRYVADIGTKHLYRWGLVHNNPERCRQNLD